MLQDRLHSRIALFTTLLTCAASLCAQTPSSKPQIFSLAYSPDGKWLALGGYKEVRLIDLATRRQSGLLRGHAEVVRSVAFSKDGKRLAAGGGVAGRKGEVKIWDL